MSTNVQAFVSNFSYFANFNDFKATYINRGGSNIEALLNRSARNWSVPRWSHEGDIILFLYSKKAGQRINEIAKSVEKLGQGPRRRFSNYSMYARKIEEGKELYKKYGGTIVGIGRLTTDPSLANYNFQTQTGAVISDIHILENPLPSSKFTHFLRISQGGITPVWGEWYEKIKQMIIDTNDNLPEYFLDSASMTDEQANINDNNWLEVNRKLNFNYRKEEAFRTFYVDYLLKDISDDATFYTECACYKEGLKSPSYADYFISIGGKWLPVETKIDINVEKDIDAQVSKYCDLTEVILDPLKGEGADPDYLIQTKVLIIDEREIQIYDHVSEQRFELAKLKDIRTLNDIQTLRNDIIEMF